MTSLASRVAWLPAAIARVAVVTPEALRTGRHAEPEWSRESFDPQRDGDPFEWLGFSA